MLSILSSNRVEAQAFNLERLVMPGPVIQAHASIEESCVSCHAENENESQDALCGDCHTDVVADRAAGRGFHGLNPAVGDTDCFSCHQEHEGRDADSVSFSEAGFDHVFTDFQLIGAHTQLDCAGCHVADTKFSAAQNTCVGCHGSEDVHMGVLGDTCMDCHTEEAWNQVSFDHAATLFPLGGAHATTQCVDCHRNQTFVGTPLRCASCHAGDDVHNGRNGNVCADCHSDVDWALPNFDHWMVSGFALEGAHRNMSCQSCHTVDLATALPQTCVGCHSNDDPHQGRLGENCASCHNSNQWANTEFDHFGVTGFELVGTHMALSCVDCHVTSIEAALPNDCVGCHEQDPHLGQLGTACVDCHAQVSWTSDVLFDHGLTNFPLVGLHAEADCQTCHATSAFHDAAENCIDCHAEDDVHNGIYGSMCATCHSPVAWQSWMFDHDLVAAFPLTGAHSALDCTTCHQESVQGMAQAGATCATCHRHEDPHEGRFGPDCGSCHSTETF